MRNSGKFDNSYGALALWTAIAPTSGSDTITLKLSTCTTWGQLTVAEFRHASPGSVAFGYGTSTTPTAAVVTSSGDGVFGGLLTGNSYNSVTAGSGFTIASNDGGSCAGEYKLSGVNNPQSAGWSVNPSTDWNVAALELRPAG